MAVPAGVIVAWPSTAASIPSGWSRVTSLDDRYVKGAGEGQDPDDTGGAATHTHTSPSHSHNVPSHTHTTPISSGQGVGGIGSVSGFASGGNLAHDHSLFAGPTGSASGALTGVATWQAASSDPPFVRVIWIASDGSADGIPDGAWALWADDAGLPDDWVLASAAEDRFLKGAAAAGDGGGTGGAETHTHNAASHSHTTDHTHTTPSTGFTTPASVDFDPAGGGSPGSGATESHSHGASTTTNTSSSSATSAATGSADGQPPFTKIAVAENDTGGDDLPLGIIAAYLGPLSTIPGGWALCDGSNGTPDLRGQFTKGAADLSEVGDTGGAAGHTHSAPSGHTHTHSHQGRTASTTALDVWNAFAGTLVVQSSGHFHVYQVGNSGASDSAVQSVDTNADTQPPFRTVLFIQFKFAVEVVVTEPPPAGTVAAPAFGVEWTLEVNAAPVTQAEYRVRIYNAAQDTVVYDSGEVASAVQEHTVGAWAPQNNTTYYLRVDATDEDGAAGTSEMHEFATDWAPPAIIGGVTVTPVGGVS